MSLSASHSSTVQIFQPARTDSSSSDESNSSSHRPYSPFSFRSIFNEPQIISDEELPRYLDTNGDQKNREFFLDDKALPPVPLDKGKDSEQKMSREFPYFDYPASHPYLPSSTQRYSLHSPSTNLIRELEAVLGPDNVPHTTEIDYIPCAGFCIPQGPLVGLLAWRLVVRSSSGAEGWWKATLATPRERRRSTILPPALPNYSNSRLSSDINSHAAMRVSTLSLPLYQSASLPPSKSHWTGSVDLTRRSPLSAGAQPETPHSASRATIVVNFILDTSMPYSVISRESLIALGYPSEALPPATNPRKGWNDVEADNTPAMVTLIIQNIPTRLRIAGAGEASRLGVQFLRDAGVSVFFPRNADAVGPILYVESDRFQDVPRTVTYNRTKLTLPQRVKALLGLK